MRLTLQLLGATIIDLHIRDDDPEPEEPDTPAFSYGFGSSTAHTELAGPQVQPLTEGEPYDRA